MDKNGLVTGVRPHSVCVASPGLGLLGLVAEALRSALLLLRRLLRRLNRQLQAKPGHSEVDEPMTLPNK